MFQSIRFAAVGKTRPLIGQSLIGSSTAEVRASVIQNVQKRGFALLSGLPSKTLCSPVALKHLSLPSCAQPSGSLPASLECVPVRTVTKFSHKLGKRKTVHAVLRRFKRLDWGGWIRTKCGRHKKMFKKKANRKHRLRQHVLINSTQSTLLNKMCTKFWHRPRHFVDDIYEPYHTRSFYWATRKPIPMPPEPLKRKVSWENLAKGNY